MAAATVATTNRSEPDTSTRSGCTCLLLLLLLVTPQLCFKNTYSIPVYPESRDGISIDAHKSHVFDTPVTSIPVVLICTDLRISNTNSLAETIATPTANQMHTIERLVRHTRILMYAMMRYCELGPRCAQRHLHFWHHMMHIDILRIYNLQAMCVWCLGE